MKKLFLMFMMGMNFGVLFASGYESDEESVWSNHGCDLGGEIDYFLPPVESDLPFPVASGQVLPAVFQSSKQKELSSGVEDSVWIPKAIPCLSSECVDWTAVYADHDKWLAHLDDEDIAIEASRLKKKGANRYLCPHEQDMNKEYLRRGLSSVGLKRNFANLEQRKDSAEIDKEVAAVFAKFGTTDIGVCLFHLQEIDAKLSSSFVCYMHPKEDFHNLVQQRVENDKLIELMELFSAKKLEESKKRRGCFFSSSISDSDSDSEDRPPLNKHDNHITNYFCPALIPYPFFGHAVSEARGKAGETQSIELQ